VAFSLPAARVAVVREAVVLWELVIRFLTGGRLRRLGQQHPMRAAAGSPDCGVQRWQHDRAVCGGGDGGAVQL
jgi:hypothetical protein